MRAGWRIAARVTWIIFVDVGAAAGCLWVLGWAIVQNDADRTSSAYQDVP
jgi:hypothetical protein